MGTDTCTKDRSEISTYFFSIYMFVWTIFVIKVFRDDDLLKLNKENIKNTVKFSKEMALDNKKKEKFDGVAM
tara:strand:- start:90 stop:305 length:216 start_codon:yes stop_codon:yes gene_type:complete